MTNTTTNRNQNLVSKYRLKNGGLSGKPLFKKSNIILKKNVTVLLMVKFPYRCWRNIKWK